MTPQTLHRRLSKSRLIAFRQCPKRLWLEVHRPELKADSPATQLAFRLGHETGELARRLADPAGRGTLIDLRRDGVEAALELTRQSLQGDSPIFEAGFAAGGAIAFADILRPIGDSCRKRWAMVEVKSSTSVKPYQLDDVAIQSRLAVSAGVDLAHVAIAHIDPKWTYPGGGDYRGLLVEVDVTEQALERHIEVDQWIAQAREVVSRDQAPEVPVGRRCSSPFRCGFWDHCAVGRPPSEVTVAWLPGRQSAKLERHIVEHAVSDIRQLPAALLTPLQRRVRDVVVDGRPRVDADGLARALAGHQPPAYFLDFEAVQFAVPRWVGARPYQMLPFQFSVHRLHADGSLTHDGFLDLSGDDPSVPFAEALVRCCRSPGPVFVYNASFEGALLDDLARRVPQHAQMLRDLRRRLVDLYPITLRHYCHPAQRGNWSLKHLLPAVAPTLRYEDLPTVRGGDMAMQAYLEAIDPMTPCERRSVLSEGLARYCELDTRALAELFRCLNRQAFPNQAEVRDQ